MQFGNLQFLWTLWIIPLVIAFAIWASKRKQALIEAFVSPELKERLLSGVSFERQRLKMGIFILAIFFSIIALIRPKYGFHWEEVRRRGIDILVAIDVSKSMMAQDVAPNRLERAKREIIDLLKIAQGDRIGLIAFAGASFLQCPLTLDYGAVQIFLDDLDTNLIPVPGTAIGEAITKAGLSFDQAGDHGKALILITDGEDHEGDPIGAAKKIAEQKVHVYAIGIGKEGGAPIPDEKTGGFKKNSRGELILSKLDEQSLQEIALATGGSYVRSTTGDLDFERIYADIKAKMEDKDLLSGQRKRFEERFQWPLALALLLLFTEMLLSERISKKRRRWFNKTTPIWVAGLLFSAFINSDNALANPFSASNASKGASAYEKGDFQNALQNFLAAQVEDPANANLKYDLANTYHQLGDYEKAQTLYEDVLRHGDQNLKKQSVYNLGNNAYRQGKLDEAVKYYEQALAMDPKNDDASANLEFVREEIKRRIEEQKKRQEQQKNNKSDQDQNQDQKKDQNQDQKQDDKQGQDQKQDQNQDRKQDDKQGQEQKQDDKQGQEQKDDKKQQGTDDKEEKAEDKKPESGQKDEKKDQPDEDEKKSPEDKNEGGEKQGAAEQKIQDNKEAQGMNEDEALRWLSNLEDEARKAHMQKQMKSSKSYRTEKDW